MPLAMLAPSVTRPVGASTTAVSKQEPGQEIQWPKPASTLFIYYYNGRHKAYGYRTYKQLTKLKKTENTLQLLKEYTIPLLIMRRVYKLNFTF